MNILTNLSTLIGDFIDKRYFRSEKCV